MKLLKHFALLCFIALAVTACNKDDDNNKEASLIDTWRLESEVFNSDPQVLDECDLLSTIGFNETTVTLNYYEGDECENLFTYEFLYTREGDVLILDSGVITLEITALTNTTLVLTQLTEEGDIFISTYTRQ